MTAADEISNSLTPAVDDLDTAKTQAAAASNHAADVREKALAHGWDGIASGMQEVIDHLDTVQSAIGRAADQGNEAAGQVRDITARTSPAQIRDHLTAAISKIDDTRRAINDAAAGLDDADNAVSRTLEGGDPGQLLSMIDEARQSLDSARQHTDNARSSTEAEIQEAAQAGN